MLNFDMTGDGAAFLYSSTVPEAQELIQAIGAIANKIDTVFTNVSFSKRDAGLHSDHQPFMLPRRCLRAVVAETPGCEWSGRSPAAFSCFSIVMCFSLIQQRTRHEKHSAVVC